MKEYIYKALPKSHLTRVRGLKYLIKIHLTVVNRVAPYTGAQIKTMDLQETKLEHMLPHENLSIELSNDRYFTETTNLKPRHV